MDFPRNVPPCSHLYAMNRLQKRQPRLGPHLCLPLVVQKEVPHTSLYTHPAPRPKSRPRRPVQPRPPPSQPTQPRRQHAHPRDPPRIQRPPLLDVAARIDRGDNAPRRLVDADDPAQERARRAHAREQRRAQLARMQQHGTHGARVRRRGRGGCERQLGTQRAVQRRQACFGRCVVGCMDASARGRVLVQFVMRGCRGAWGEKGGRRGGRGSEAYRGARSRGSPARSIR